MQRNFVVVFVVGGRGDPGTLPPRSKAVGVGVRVPPSPKIPWGWGDTLPCSSVTSHICTRGAQCRLPGLVFNIFWTASTTLRLPDYVFQRFQDGFDYHFDYQTTRLLFSKKNSALRAADLLYKQYIIPCCSACTRVYDIRTLDNTWFVIFDFATATARDAEETRDSYMYMQEICK